MTSWKMSDDSRRGMLMLLLAATFWMIGRPYEGINHDSQLYMLQALARLYPTSLGQDVFLKFGSQDDFTIFSPVYAAVIALLGAEDASRYLTLAGQLWWFAALVFLAVGLLGARRGWLAVAIVAALPGYYGAFDIFRYAEPFLTSRLFAEACVLTGLALTTAGHRWPGGLFVLSAMALHPLIGMGGLLVWAALVAAPRLRRWMFPGVLAGCLLAAAVAVLAPVYPLAQFDPEWLELVRNRSSFLFLQDWTAAAWEGITLTIVTVWIFGSATAPGRARTLLLTSAGMGALGLVVSGVGSAFDVVLLIQGQAWRWTWVAGALVGLAAVAGAGNAWQEGPGARAALLLLATAWLLSGWEAVAPAGLAAVCWTARRRLDGRVGRIAMLVALALFVAAAYLWLWRQPLWSPLAPPDSLRSPTWYQAKSLLADGILGSLIATGLWFAAQRMQRLAAAFVAVGGVAALTAVAVVPDWSRVEFTTPDRSEVAAWKAIIPEDAEVLWPADNVAPWLLLGRRNYMSTSQAAGVVFSRPATMEMLKRARELILVQGPSMVFGPGFKGGFWSLNSRTLVETCNRSRVDFVVLGDRLAVGPVAGPVRLRDRAIGSPSNYYLYDCRPLRAARG